MTLVNPLGPQGVAGTTGSTGAAGPRGATWYQYIGAGTPTGLTGMLTGDFAVRSSDGEVFSWNGTAWTDQGYSLAGTLSLGLDGSHAAAGNDTRLMNPDPPGLHGFLATSIRDREASSTTRPGSGTLILTRVYLPVPITVTNVVYQVGATGSNNQTGFFAGIYDSGGNLLRGSADQHTVMNAASAIGNLIICPLTSTYSWAGGAGAFLYAAYLAIGGTTLPAITCSPANTQAVDTNMSATNKACMQLLTQASLPTPTWGAPSGLTVQPWVALT